MNDKFIEEVITETGHMFNEIYCGCELLKMNKKKVLFFVKKALISYHTKLFWEKKRIERESRKNRKKIRG